ncbi:MAG: SDR family NAD(P)-dependent oxidoreductase [Nitrospiraceae bacterium]|nr:SDR family NAD(P)-dependent oxidoreductase [Nitrospiraceae bacterium]
MKVLITGASRGLGKALAEECLGRGHEVWGVSRSVPSSGTGRLHYLQCDIAALPEVSRAAEEMRDAGFIPDVFVLNAAAIREDFDGGLDLEAVRETFETNLFGNLYWLTLFLPLLKEKPDGAVFLNISSAASFRAVVRRKVAYPASKAAMDMMFEGLRIQCGGGKVRFATVNLGPLAEKRRLPLVSASYGDAAAKIISTLESGKTKGQFCYPRSAGWLYRVARFFPDGAIRWFLR